MSSFLPIIILMYRFVWVGDSVRPRKSGYGNKNICGANIERIRKAQGMKQIVLVSVLVPLLMWFVFYKLLTVNIPMGVLTPLKTLVDMI